jgi:hypothetical protein
MTEIFELVYHGNGGFSWYEVWDMPVVHRKFSLKKINEFLGKVEAARNEGSQTITDKTDMSKFKLPKEVESAMKSRPDFVSKPRAKK